MKIAPGTPLHAGLDFGLRAVPVGRLALDRGIAVFEYATEFIPSALSINPLLPRPAPGLVRPRAPRVITR